MSAAPILLLLLLLGGGKKKKKKKATGIVVAPPAGPVGPPKPVPGIPQGPIGPAPPPKPPAPTIGPVLPAGPKAPPAVAPVQVYEQILTDRPTFGGLYQVQQGDNIGALVQELLGVDPGDAAVGPYVRKMTNVRWNWMLYVVAARKNPAGNWPYHAARFNGSGERGTLTQAPFLPGNDNVRSAVQQQALPHRSYTWNVNPNDGRPFDNGRPNHGPQGFGVLYFPPMVCTDANDPDCNPTALIDALGKTLADLTPSM